MADETRISQQIVELLSSSSDKVRISQQIAEILSSSSDKVRISQQIAEILSSSSDKVRISQQIVELLIPYSPIENLAATINGSGLVTANIKIPGLKASINSNGLVVASLNSHTRQLVASINGSAAVTGFILDPTINFASSTITFTQSATQLRIQVGSTILLTQSVALLTVLNPSITSALTLTQSATNDTTIIKSVLTELDLLRHNIVFAHVLPTKTASSSLSLSDSAVSTRLAFNVLNLTHVAVGVIGGILESASSTLSLTQNVDYDFVTNRSVQNTLLFSQESISGHVDLSSCSNSLLLNHIVYSVLRNKGATANNISGHDCYVVLQAPFSFLQTSVVLPCPLFGDTENLVSEMSLKRSMNGGTVTYVKTNANRRLTYTFRLLDTLKAREIMEFFKYYNSDYIRLTNHKSEVWKVRLLTNPIDFVKTGRFSTDVSLEFEGEKLYG